MADITNTLTTVLRVTGAGQMASAFSQGTQLLKTFGLAQEATGLAGVRLAEIQGRLASETAAANSIRQFAIIATHGMTAAQAAANPIMAQLTAAEQAAAVAAGELAVAEAAAAGPLILITGFILALTAAVMGSVAALKTFAEESKAAFQAAVVFRNLGLQTTPEQLRAQVGAVSRATGFQRPELLAEAGKLAATGVQEGRIQETLKAIGNAARGTGKEFDQVGEAIERGIMGKMKGLTALKINLHDAGTETANLNQILREVEKRYGNAAEAFRSTLPGAVENFQRSMRDLFEEIGDRLAPTVIAVLNKMADAVDYITDHLDQILFTLSVIFPAFAQILQQGGRNPMAQVGHGGDPASDTRHLGEIAENTKKQVDSLETAILGGAGTEVRGAFGHLQARLALAI